MLETGYFICRNVLLILLVKEYEMIDENITDNTFWIYSRFMACFVLFTAHSCSAYRCL